MSAVRAFIALVVIGAVWGLTVPLTKISVSTGYQPFGLIFWQAAIGVVVLFTALMVRGQAMPTLGRTLPLFAMVAVLGTLIPNAVSFRAAQELPAGVMAVVIAIVPMFALPIALVLGLERLRLVRILGIGLGAIAIVMIAAPEASLPDSSKAVWVLIALISPLAYAFEGNLLAKFGSEDLDPMALLFGASLIVAGVTLVLALVTGQWINPVRVWGAPEWSHVANSVLHVAAYSGYIWLINTAGAVFGAQVAYLVTGTGVVWSMLILGERYSLWIWGALAVMMIGLALVQPRKDSAG